MSTAAPSPSGIVVVEDSDRVKIIYTPSDNWKPNENCVACNVTNVEARNRLLTTASAGTWTNAWWSLGIPRISATLEFQGTSLSVYFILFTRSLDPEGSRGPSLLNFYMDEKVDSVVQIHASNYSFVNDMTDRMLMYEAANLDSATPHTVKIEWDNANSENARPEVALALDTIEYRSSQIPLASTTTSSNLSSATPPDLPSASAPPLLSPPPSPNKSLRIALSAALSALALILLILAFILYKRRRDARKLKLGAQGPLVHQHTVQPFTVPGFHQSPQGPSQMYTPSYKNQGGVASTTGSGSGSGQGSVGQGGSVPSGSSGVGSVAARRGVAPGGDGYLDDQMSYNPYEQVTEPPPYVMDWEGHVGGASGSGSGASVAGRYAPVRKRVD